MCKLLLIHPRSAKGAADAVAMLEHEAVTLCKEPHGIAVYGAGKVCRDVADYREPLEYARGVLSGGEFAVVHTRMATMGAITADNTHLWERNGWRFAHNGVAEGAETARGYETELKKKSALYKVLDNCAVCWRLTDGGCKKHRKVWEEIEKIEAQDGINPTFGFTGTARSGKTDSEGFFEALTLPPSEENIRKVMDARKFYGVGFLFTDSEMLLLATRYATLATAKSGAYMLGSYAVSRAIEKVRTGINALGIRVVHRVAEVLKVEEVDAGVQRFKLTGGGALAEEKMGQAMKKIERMEFPARKNYEK